MKQLFKKLILPAVLSLSVLAAYGQQPIYHDEFVPGQTGWRNYDDANTNAVLRNGAYILTHKKSNYTYSGTAPLAIDENRDYSIETTVSHIQGDNQAPFGLAFGATSVADLYYFGISSNGFYMLTKQVNYVYNAVIPWTQSASIMQGNNVANKLRIEKRGSQLSLFINDQQVAQVPMVQPFGSSIGFIVMKSQTAAFNYIKAAYLPAADANRLVSTSVASTGYHTNFNSDDANGWSQNRTDSASVYFANGRLNVTRTAKGWLTSVLSAPSAAVDMHRDFLIEMEASHAAGGQNYGYGLDFGASETRVYHFWISASGYYYIGFTERNAFNTIVAFTQNDAIIKGENVRNKLGIAHKNGQLHFYINNQEVETHPGLDFYGGRFGLSVSGPQSVGFNSLNFAYLDKAVPATVTDSVASVPQIYITSPEVTRGLKVVQASDVLHVAGIATDRAGIFSVRVNDVQATVDAKGNFTADVPMAVGDNPLMVTALNNNMAKATYTFHVVRNNISAAVQASVAQVASKGKFYALLVGEQDYRDPNIPSLDGPVNDAGNLAQALTGNYTFSPENVTVLKNPTRAEFFKALDDISGKVKSEDNLIIFYAGHGLYDETHLQGYWFPSDAVRDRRDTWISNADLIDYITAIKSKHTMLISDACFSGSIFKTRGVEMAPKDIQEVYNLTSRKAMTSGAMKEVPDKSVFIEYLLKRLNQNTDKFLPAEQLFASFKTAVINNSPNGQVPQFGEIRETGDEGGDFVFIKKD